MNSRYFSHGVKILLVIALAVATYIGLVLLLKSTHDSDAALFIMRYIHGYGLIAVFLMSMIFDIIVSPLSPDLSVLFAVNYGLSPVSAVLVTTIASTASGIIDYSVGKRLSRTKLVQWIGEKNFNAGRESYEKYGIWAILIGAMTPVPYSVTCYLGGFFSMPLRKLVITAFLARTVRFAAISVMSYYIVNS